MLESVQSKGEIICFLMLMTTFTKDKLSLKVVAGFLDHPEVQISPLISVNREGLPTNRVLKALKAMCVIRCCNGESTSGELLPGRAYRRLALKQVLPIPARTSCCGDTYLPANSFPLWKGRVLIKEPLMFHRTARTDGSPQR